MPRYTPGLLALFPVLGLLAILPAAEQPPSRDHLAPGTFPELHKTLCLQSGEYRWDEIPWIASVWHARKKAAAENKPIFVFGTAGAGFNDPLGNC